MKMKSLARFTNRQLHSAAVSLSRQERECTLAIVDHLIEIERRRLFAERGHSSVYGYCTDELGYSRTAANRRIVAARAVRRYPRIRLMLQERRLTLSTLAAIGRDLDGENCRTLLSRVCGKSAKEVERAIAELRGIRPVREKIQHVVAIAKGGAVKAVDRVDGDMKDADNVVSSAACDAQPDLLSGTPAQLIVGTQDVQSEVRCGPENTQPIANTGVTASKMTEHRFRFEFSGDEAFMALYQQAAVLVSNRLGGQVSIEETMKIALQALVERDDPGRRKSRRESRAARATPAKEPRAAGKQVAGTTGRDNRDRASTLAAVASATQHRKRSRHIPAVIRDAVHERDGRRCTFMSDQGRRCRAVRNLHIDHIFPWARGGAHELSNLRLLCATHNRLVAEREFGASLVSRQRE